MLRIRVDFNSLSPDGTRVPISKYVGVSFQQFYTGRRVILYEPSDFEVEAVLVYLSHGSTSDEWDAAVDWSTKRNLISE